MTGMSRPVRWVGIALWLAVLWLIAGCGGRQVVVPPPPTTAKKSPPPQPSPEPRSLPRAEPSARAPEPPPPTAERPVPSFPRPGNMPNGAGPIMRIGILPSTGPVTVASEAKFYLTMKAGSDTSVPAAGTLTISPEVEGGSAGETRKIYRVQIASLTRAKDAEALKRKLEGEGVTPVLMQFNPNAAAYRLRVGQYDTPAAATEAAEQLRQRRYTQATVVPETVSIDPGGERRPTLRAAGGEISRRSATGFRITPSAHDPFIKVNGKPYRGTVEVIPGRNGKLAVINELPLEEYLKGVVPEELPPTAFPQMEALKAQAIAARTYAMKHKGQFQSEGYDLLASDRSQVYGGVASEQPLSTQAVEETAGLALYANGRLIDALYTSTCGGRTEDFENLFGGPPVSYLRGVTCAIDQDSEAAPQRELRVARRGEGRTSDRAVKGAPPELALLNLIGVLPSRVLSEAYLSEVPPREEIKEWVRRTTQALRRKPTDSEGDARLRLDRLAYFCVYLVEQVFSRQAAGVLISDADTQYYLASFRDRQDIPGDTRRPIALLVQKNILIPYPDNTLRPLQALPRRTMLGMIYRTLEALSGLSLESGTLVKAQDNQLQIKNGRATLEARLADDLYLFQRIGNERVATDAIQVIGGETVRYHRTDGRIDYLEVQLSANGAASDRYSRFTQWEVAMTIEEATKKLREVFKLGRLIDLQPTKFGVSHRVIEMKVIGSQGEFMLKGLRIRSVLGLRDTLFTMAREQGEDESIRRFIFNGRGWGHGVGLCQTGAYGMALAGERAEAILKKYYTGTEIRKAY